MHSTPGPPGAEKICPSVLYSVLRGSDGTRTWPESGRNGATSGTAAPYGLRRARGRPSRFWLLFQWGTDSFQVSLARWAWYASHIEAGSLPGEIWKMSSSRSWLWAIMSDTYSPRTVVLDRSLV